MSHGEYYQIIVKGVLGPQWSEHFGGLTVTSKLGHTTLAGVLVDQAALHGLLTKIRDLALPILSVQRLEPDPSIKTTIPKLNVSEAIE